MAKQTRNDRNTKVKQNFIKRPAFIIILIIFGILFLYIANKNGLLTLLTDDGGLNGEFAVHFIDVGQGDSMLIQSPDNEFILIDTGENDQYNKLSGYLEHFNVTDFKYVIFTHPHSDHIGSAYNIVRDYGIKTLIMPSVVNNIKTFDKLVSEIEIKVDDGDLELLEPERGASYEFGGAEFVILAPSSKEYENLNNYSVVIELKYGKTKFLFTGDIEKESENEIINYCKENNLDISADVIKVAHHGSSTSTQQSILDLVKPSIAVICCGTDNNYNHPNLKVVERLGKAGAQVLRTDLDGDIVITSDGATVTIK